MNQLFYALIPELILTSVACALFVFGATGIAALRRFSPWLALASLPAAAWAAAYTPVWDTPIRDSMGTLFVGGFAVYIKLITALVGILLVLVHWPTTDDADGNSCVHFGRQGPEYFGLMLLSLAGVMLVAGANDVILLFLGIELAAIPTYVMVSISRPISSAQEAAVKYFFLGAFSAALTLFGLSFLFGTTGKLGLIEIAQVLRPATGNLVQLTAWQMLAGLMVLMGLAFKMAAFPMHFYAPDVYTGAATPLTALLSYVPKAAGLVALIKVLGALFGGGNFVPPAEFVTLLWVIAVATMFVGNVLGLMQHNVKRIMACSSIAHSGYMLAGVLVAVSAGTASVRDDALEGVLFYLAAYGVMNVGVFAVLMMLPAKADPFLYEGKIPPATSAETLGEIAGSGRQHPGLGLIMAGCCFSLVGLPLTVGFFGKLFLIRPALEASMYWLVVLMVLNAAISAGYYLRIVATMFLKDPRTEAGAPEPAGQPAAELPMPLLMAGVLSVCGSLILGTLLPATTVLRNLTKEAVTFRVSAMPMQSQQEPPMVPDLPQP